MARNEDGEFELMLGNKQLLSVFFLMVVLLVVCFVGGYWLGRSTTPLLTAAKEPPPQSVISPVSPAPAKVETQPSASTNPPARTAPQVAEKASEPAKEPPAPKQAPPKEAPKVEAKADAKTKTPPPAAKEVAAAKPAPSSGPVPGRIYLQLSATDKDKADVMVDLLRRKNFAGMAAPVAERPGLFRVLVGPLAENALAQTKAQLKASGFPGDEAIRRVF